MKPARIAMIMMVAFTGIVASPITQAQGDSGTKSLTPGDIKWSDNPSLPKGSKYAVLSGDPTKQGLFVVRIRYPANVRQPAHTHPQESGLTVLSGTLLYGQGDKFDVKKLKAWPVGSYIVEAPNRPHFLATKGEVLIQVAGPGPIGTDFINPMDDPGKK